MAKLIKLIPYESFTLQTSDPVSRVREKLAASIAAPQPLRWFRSRSHVPYTGNLDETGFEIRRIIYYRNSFLPIIRGQFEPTAQGTAIHIKMGLHPLVIAFLVAWGSIWYSVLLLMVLAGAVPGEVAIACFTIPLVVLAIFWGAFWYEVRRSRQDLVNLLIEEIAPQPPAYPRFFDKPWWKVAQVGLILMGIALQIVFIYVLYPSSPGPSSFPSCTQDLARSPHCTLTLTHQLNHPSAQALALSNDGRILASGGQDKAIRVWDTETGQLLQTLQSDSGEVLALAIAPDGNTLVSGSADRMVRIWNLTTNQPPLMLKGHAEAVSFIRLSSDGQTVISGSYNEVKRWNLATGQLESSLSSLSKTNTQLGPVTLESSPNMIVRAIRADGKIAIFELYSGKVIAWDLISDQHIADLSEPFDTVSQDLASAEISPDGTLAILLYNNSVRKYETLFKIWDLSTGEVKASGRAAYSRTWFPHVSVALTGDRILGSTEDGLKLWNLQTGEPEVLLDVDKVGSLVTNLDGTVVAGILGDADSQSAKINVLQQN